MNWDLERLQSLFRDFPWFRTAYADVDGPTFDGFALFNYTPWYLARGDDDLKYVSSLILDFEKNDAAATEAVNELVCIALGKLIQSGGWKGKSTSLRSPAVREAVGPAEIEKWALANSRGILMMREMIVIPGSTAGIGKAPSSGLAGELRLVGVTGFSDPEEDPVLEPFEKSGYALERHTSQTPSHIGKKSIQDHLQTVRLIPPEGTAVKVKFSATSHRYMLIDDVYTRGATYGACKQLIRQRHSAADVIGLFVGITAY